MNGLFRKVPLRENYKEVPDDIVRLKAPPNISRACFIVEISVASIAFALSFYISFTSTVSVTSITYEPLDSPYVCKVLSPRSDSLAFSTVTNEMVAFSSARFLLDECTSTLDSSGLDVCADGQRQDYLLGFSGVSAQDSNCFDILLDNNLRFCFGTETETRLSSESFPTSATKPSTIYTSSFYYFMNDSATVRGFTAPFSSQLADWVVSNNKIYTIAPRNSDQRTYLFEFDPLLGSTSWSSLAAPKALVFVDVGGSTVIGLAVANNFVHVWAINAQNSIATLYSYSLDTSTLVSHTYDCTSLTDTTYSIQNNGVYRYLASSEDGTLYAMCGKNVYNGAYAFYSIDTTTYIATKLYTDLLSLAINKNGVASNDSINAVSTLAVLNNHAYFTTGAPIYNIVQVDLTPQPTPAPTFLPSVLPSRVPTARPTPAQSPAPGTPPPVVSTIVPTVVPSAVPTIGGTEPPTIVPTTTRTIVPTAMPTAVPTLPPSTAPTAPPTNTVSAAPTVTATVPPTAPPTIAPTSIPTVTSTEQPTSINSPAPSITQTAAPTLQPTIADTDAPTQTPTLTPTQTPILIPTTTPTLAPVLTPTLAPTTTATAPLTPGSSPAGSPAAPGPPGPPGMPSVRRLMESPVSGGSNSDGSGGSGGSGSISEVETLNVDTSSSEVYSMNVESYSIQRTHHAHLQLTAGPNNYIMQPAVNVGFHSGSSLQRGYGHTVYVTSDSAPYVSAYYNATSGEFGQYDSFREEYFMTTSVELGYSFAVCNGVVLNDTSVDPTVSTSYKDICDDINGIYYQNNHYHTMPATCTSVFTTPQDASTTTVEALYECVAVSALVANYTAINCADSFDKICEASYTDNPPFSCTSHERPDFLTTLGSALSNASALWSLIAILISLTLRRAYPGGVLANLYDPHDGELKSEKVKYKYAHGAAVYPVSEDEEEGAGGDVRYEKMDRQGTFGDIGDGSNEVERRVEGGDEGGGDEGGGDGGIASGIEGEVENGAMGGGAEGDNTKAQADAAPTVAHSKSSKSNISSKSSNNMNKLSHKPAKKEEEADGCCVSFLDECQC